MDAPNITSISPVSGLSNAELVITGTGFSNAELVLIGGVPVPAFSVDSDIQITATAPFGGNTGYVVVVSPDGNSVSPVKFSYTALNVMGTLREKLKAEAMISAQENITDPMIEDFFFESLLEFDSERMSVETLNPREQVAVRILGFMRVCLCRAAAHVNDVDLKDANRFSTTKRDTPYGHNMAMHAALSIRYKNAISNMQLTTGAGQPAITTLVRQNAYEEMTPYAEAPIAATPRLSIFSSAADGTLILNLQATFTDTTRALHLFYDTNPGIYTPSSPSPISGIPFIASTAARLAEIVRIDQSQIKLTGLTAGATYYFVLVHETTSRRCTYSPELQVVMPT